MPISPTTLTESANALLGATSANTASITINDNRLVSVEVNLCLSSAPSSPPTISGASLTWTLKDSVPGYATGTRWHGLYVFEGFNSSGSDQTGALTMTFNGACRTIGFKVVQWGPNGAEVLYIAQIKPANGTGSSLSVTMDDAFEDSVNNASVAVLATGGSTASSPSGEHTAIGSAQTNTSIVAAERQGLSMDYQIGEDLTRTGTGNGDNWAAIAFEVGANTPPPSSVRPSRLALMGVS